MTAGTVLAVCRVHQLHPTRDTVGVTAIDKRPVDGPVHVYDLGLTGDVQVSRRHHGGETKAVYAYSQADADYWAAELGREIPPGLFGENLRVAGIDASNALVGERWRIGGTLELEVTGPRTPCRNFQDRMGEPRFTARFTQAARTGAYLRVLKAGPVAAGDAVEVLSKPAHGVSIAQVFRGPDEDQIQALFDAGRAGLKLAPELVRSLRRASRRHAAAADVGPAVEAAAEPAARA